METGFTAPTIDFAVELAEWRKVADELTVKTRLMWQDGRFHDYNVVRNGQQSRIPCTSSRFSEMSLVGGISSNCSDPSTIVEQ